MFGVILTHLPALGPVPTAVVVMSYAARRRTLPLVVNKLGSCPSGKGGWAAVGRRWWPRLASSTCLHAYHLKRMMLESTTAGMLQLVLLFPVVKAVRAGPAQRAQHSASQTSLHKNSRATFTRASCHLHTCFVPCCSLCGMSCSG